MFLVFVNPLTYGYQCDSLGLFKGWKGFHETNVDEEGNRTSHLSLSIITLLPFNREKPTGLHSLSPFDDRGVTIRDTSRG